MGLGLAGFVDHGGAWYSGSRRRTGWDAGIGLRVGASRSTDTPALRFDLAHRFAIVDEMQVVPDPDGRRGSAADTFRRLYWDTALAWSDPVLRMLRAVVGLDRVVYGSDYPYLRPDLAVRGRAELEATAELSGDERAAMFHGTATTLIPRLGKVTDAAS